MVGVLVGVDRILRAAGTEQNKRINANVRSITAHVRERRDDDDSTMIIHYDQRRTSRREHTEEDFTVIIE